MPVPELTREQRSLGGKISGMVRRANAEVLRAAKEKSRSERRRMLEDAVWEVLNTPQRKKFKDPLRQLLAAYKKSEPTAFVVGLLMKLLPPRRK